MADMCQNIQDGRQVSLSDCSKWLSSVRIFKMANLCQNIQGSRQVSDCKKWQNYCQIIKNGKLVSEYSRWPDSVRIFQIADLCQNIQDGRLIMSDY